MARGDSISYAGYGSYTYTYLTPASGDEWLITMFGCQGAFTGGWGSGFYAAYMYMTPDGGTNWYEMWSSENDQIDVDRNILDTDFQGRELHWPLTPTVRIRLHSPGYSKWWYSGVKTKD